MTCADARQAERKWIRHYGAQILNKMERVVHVDDVPARVMLRRIVDEEGLRALSASLRLNEDHLATWVTGPRRPTIVNAVLLSRVLGIPVDAWIAPSEADRIHALCTARLEPKPE